MTAPAFKAQTIVIGASAGSIQALSKILCVLPADYALPILIVVHLPPDTKSSLPELFAAKCKIRVKEAEDKETIQPGIVYFAPPNYHLLVESNGLISLSDDEPELFSRPAINVLFESAADAYGNGVAGIILTGASEDGAHGLRIIHDAGGLTIVQDPAEAEVALMPESALKACPDSRSLNLQGIAVLLKQLSEVAV